MINPADAVQAIIQYPFPGGRCFSGPRHPWLMSAAQSHAEDMARRRIPDHHAFLSSGFLNYAQQATGCLSVRESSADSWPEHAESDKMVLAQDIWECWSYDHNTDPWKIASVSHAFYGLGAAFGSDGVLYVALIIAD